MSDQPPMRALPGFRHRPATMGDVPTVTALIADEEHLLHGTIDIVEADISGDWRRPSFDLGRDTVVVLRDREIVGYATEFGGRAEGHVHPAMGGRGVGTALLHWTELHARGRGHLTVGQTLSQYALAARRLLGAHGYTVRWDTWILQRDLDAAPPAPVLPTGLRLRTVQRGPDDRHIHQLIDAAFSEWPNRDASLSFEDWRAAYLDRDDADPGLVFVVEDGKGPVGVALCLEDRSEGWVEQLAVASSHRRRGLGQALLTAAFREFRRRGLATAGVSTDSRTGARVLYERVGMRITRSYARYARDLA